MWMLLFDDRLYYFCDPANFALEAIVCITLLSYNKSSVDLIETVMNIQTLGLFIISMKSLKTRINILRSEYKKVKSNVSRSSHQ